MADLAPGSARAFAEQVAAHRGWRLNPDARHLAEVLAGLETNRQRHGYYLCPCRDGAGDRRRDADITCPCDYAEADLAEHGHCYCGLFVSPLFAAAEVQPIPERRPAARSAAAEAEAPAAVGRDLCGIKDIVRGINELEAELRRSHGLTLNEGLCLCCITNLRHTPGECARQIGLSPSRVSRILNSLEKKGLLERHSLPDDHRSTDLVVTEKGRERLRQLRAGGFSFSRLDGPASAERAEPAR